MKALKGKPHLRRICFLLPLLLALLCLLSATLGSQQAGRPVPMPQEIIGEYSYDGVSWLPLTEDAELSALKGDLYLRGNFSMPMGEGVMMSYYRNHIALSISINGELLYADEMLSIPNMSHRLFASMCAREWMSFVVPEISTGDSVELRLHNPHRAGNKTAYRDFLNSLCAMPAGSDILEKKLDDYGDPARTLGGVFTVVSMMLLGAALAAAVLRIPVGGLLLRLGLLCLFAGGYIVFDSVDISFRSELNARNTYMTQLCMMLAVFCLQHFVALSFTDGLKKAVDGALAASALFDSLLILASLTGFAVIYDTLPLWAFSQILLCPGFILCCILQLRKPGRKTLVLSSAILLFAAILLDIAGLGGGMVWRGACSKLVFTLLCAVYIIAAARDILKNQRASLRAAKLEKELEDSRIAIMLSQIKPHFLYNVLNTIYHLYRKEPETAQEAVSSFAEYLRCNMLSIEKSEPIPFSEEYRHIRTYLSLEQIRFRGKLDVVYDVDVTDFRLPPLTVEPLVENAVKHGVTQKRGGGTVTVSTRKTAEGFTVTVADTGPGFDPEGYMEDGKPHVGIRNVRQRLERMVGGSLSIDSSPEGTVAVVSLPAKEVNIGK